MLTDVLEADLDGNLPTTVQQKVSSKNQESVDGEQENEELQKTSLLLYLSDRPKLVSFKQTNVSSIDQLLSWTLESLKRGLLPK